MLEAALLAQLVVHARGRRAVQASLASERRETWAERDQVAGVRAARSAWLHGHGAVASLPCGVIALETVSLPDEAASLLRYETELPVTAAVLADRLVFLADPPPKLGFTDPLELGEFPFGDALTFRVERDDGAPVPEETTESFEPEADAIVIVVASIGEQRLVFRSAWLAWNVIHRLRTLGVGAA